eukprot:Hpha_TRINITY_DN14117_c0_g1::TRINITY_DN14117_c0_g1_i1::g.10496::m.10496
MKVAAVLLLCCSCILRVTADRAESPLARKVCGINLAKGPISWRLRDVRRGVEGTQMLCPEYTPTDECCLDGSTVPNVAVGAELVADIILTSNRSLQQETTPITYTLEHNRSVHFKCDSCDDTKICSEFYCRLEVLHYPPIVWPPAEEPQSPHHHGWVPEDKVLPPVSDGGPPRWFVDAMGAAGGTFAVVCAAVAVWCCRKKSHEDEEGISSRGTLGLTVGVDEDSSQRFQWSSPRNMGAGGVVEHVAVAQHAVAQGQRLYACDVFAPPAHSWRLWRRDVDFDTLRLRVGDAPAPPPPPLNASEAVCANHRMQHEATVRSLLARAHGGDSSARSALSAFLQLESHTRYEPIRELGKGSFGTVWLSRRRDTGELVSLKRVLCQSHHEKTRARREVMLLQTLPLHPSVIRIAEVLVLGASTTDGNPFASVVCMVLPYYAQGDLARFIHEYPDSVIPESLVLGFTRQLCDALRLLHSLSPPVVHRDLKPANILVSDDRRRVVLTDFGLARLHDETYMHTHVGTMAFMAPEAFDGPYDSQVDLWSLGCVIYAMGTRRVRQCRVMCVHVGQVGFYSQVERELRDRGYTPLLVDLVRQLLQPSRRNRPSAEEVLFRLSSAAPNSLRLGLSPQSPGGSRDHCWPPTDASSNGSGGRRRSASRDRTRDWPRSGYSGESGSFGGPGGSFVQSYHSHRRASDSRQSWPRQHSNGLAVLQGQRMATGSPTNSGYQQAPQGGGALRLAWPRQGAGGVSGSFGAGGSFGVSGSKQVPQPSGGMRLVWPGAPDPALSSPTYSAAPSDLDDLDGRKSSAAAPFLLRGAAPPVQRTTPGTPVGNASDADGRAPLVTPLAKPTGAPQIAGSLLGGVMQGPPGVRVPTETVSEEEPQLDDESPVAVAVVSPPPGPPGPAGPPRQAAPMMVMRWPGARSGGGRPLDTVQADTGEDSDEEEETSSSDCGPEAPLLRPTLPA